MGKRISQLDAAGPISGTEQIAIVQEQRTKRVPLSTIKTYTDTSCQCTLFSRYNPVGTTTSTLTYFQTYPLGGGVVNTDGSWLSISASGIFAATGSSKLAGIGIVSPTTGLSLSFTTTSSVFNNYSWAINLKVQRSASDSIQVERHISVVSLAVGMHNPSIIQNTTNYSGWSGLWANPIIISAFGELLVAASNDIVCKLFIGQLNKLDPDS